ncbi:xyloside xylosyltransferase 1 [Galendromus occidentalis]|uniref:Xyloside xylosyltransferase 1 n=1 Tax=Galendromus occidentalis TaxID=34638 RepID=A0AAJ7P9V6_9ACAR|nr:xyloside xylosyltransferase 1 [Galendromus occidentalis]
MRTVHNRSRRRRATVAIVFAVASALVASGFLFAVLTNPLHEGYASPWRGTTSSSGVIQIIVFAKYASSKPKVVDDLCETLKSISKNLSTSLHVHVLADNRSFGTISGAVSSINKMSNMDIHYTIYDLRAIGEKEEPMVKLLRKYFFTKPVRKYDDDIFFLTPGFHRIFSRLDRAIFLDTDLRFHDDIRKLWDIFPEFTEENIIGIADDLQPMYREKFADYREKNPETDVGSPHPGKQGFNTGVVLMHLGRMRNSSKYNWNFDEDHLRSLQEKYFFNGDLGHQDFFTLLGMEYPELFYHLHCSWNRQLEMTWALRVSEELFEKYHRCDGLIKVYHANAGSKFPEEDSHASLQDNREGNYSRARRLA